MSLLQATNKTNRHNYRGIIAIGLPVVIGQLGTIVLGFADTLMIGRHSTEELAAAGLVNNIFNLVLLFYLGFSYGFTPIVGRLFGIGAQRKIGAKLKNSLAANTVVGLLLTAVVTALYFNLARIGQPVELLPLIRPYFIVNLASILFVGVFNTFKQYFDGTTRTDVAMWIMLGGNVLNIVFNWMLIYGVGIFPELGLLGAGISTLGSRIAMALAIAAVFCCGARSRESRQGYAAAHINKADFREMNRLGWPVAMQLGMETAAFSLSCVMAGWLGTLQLAAHQIAITLSQLFYLTLSGLASAVSIRISLYAGRHDFTAVRTNAADGLRLVVAISTAMAIPMLIFRNSIGALFSSNAEVQTMTAALCIMLAIYQFGDALQYTYANALRGIACVKPLVYYAFIAYFVINLPLAYIFGFTLGFGLTGIWAAFPIGLTAAGAMFYCKFRRELAKKALQPNAA
jgi:multidrug resistance protein, MATE family